MTHIADGDAPAAQDGQTDDVNDAVAKATPDTVTPAAESSPATASAAAAAAVMPPAPPTQQQQQQQQQQDAASSETAADTTDTTAAATAKAASDSKKAVVSNAVQLLYGSRKAFQFAHETVTAMAPTFPAVSLKLFLSCALGTSTVTIAVLLSALSLCAS
jgi:hypothetical protein